MSPMKSIFMIIIFMISLAGAQMSVPVKNKAPAGEPKDDDFIIKKPGEITFTSGIVIEGRVEKPQVMLVLTKEKIKSDPSSYKQSFLKNITDPLRYNTFEISKGSLEEMGGSDEKKGRRKQ